MVIYLNTMSSSCFTKSDLVWGPISLQPLVLEPCKGCLSTDHFVVNDYIGERTCTNCGIVQETSMIQDDRVEYRIFSDEDSHKQRLSQATSIYDLDSFDSSAMFLSVMKKSTLQVLEFYFLDEVPKLVKISALRVIDCAFRLQNQQKSSTNSISEYNISNKNCRKKFSERSKIIVASCYIALRDYHDSIKKSLNVDIIEKLSQQTSEILSSHGNHEYKIPTTKSVLSLLHDLNYKTNYSPLNRTSVQIPVSFRKKSGIFKKSKR